MIYTLKKLPLEKFRLLILKNTILPLTPLACINKTEASGIFPESLECANVSPIHKNI